MISPRAMKLLAANARLTRAAAQNDTQNVASPCISVCRMDESGGLCVGCLRTLDEIARWGTADAVFKRAVWRNIELRLASLQD